MKKIKVILYFIILIFYINCKKQTEQEIKSDKKNTNIVASESKEIFIGKYFFSGDELINSRYAKKMSKTLF